MDAATVTRALAELCRRAPHLPSGPDLARAAHQAWSSQHDPTMGVQRDAMAAVVAVTWPAGFSAGAVRGHGIAARWIRDADAEWGDGDAPLGTDGRWLLYAAQRAADRLTDRPDPALRGAIPAPTVMAGGSWPDEGSQLAASLWLGLEHGWRAGHRAAVAAAVDAFLAEVVDLVGHDSVITTFLDAATPAYMWLEFVADTVMAVAARDEENPPAFPTQQRGNTPPVARAFVPLQVDPRARSNAGRRPPPGPGRRLSR